MKRPRGLWKSQRSSGKPSPSELRPEDGSPEPDGDTDLKQPTKRLKRDGSPEHDELDVPRRAEGTGDIEDWDDLKELFNGVIEKYEGLHSISLGFSEIFSVFLFFSSFFSPSPPVLVHSVLMRHQQDTSSQTPSSSFVALSTNVTASCGFTPTPQSSSRQARSHKRLQA